MKITLTFLTLALSAALSLLHAQERVNDLAGKRIVFLGDSITQAGDYISFTSYYLQKLHPALEFDIYSLGLSSETLSGLSEDGHAGGRFPRPCLFERYDRLLEKLKPEVVFACYGINDGIYQPLDDERFAAFKTGVGKLIEKSKAAGAGTIFLITPPIYDASPKEGEFHYDSVMTAYAEWEMTIRQPGVHVIDLHSAMRKARDARDEVYSKDKVHPGAEGHLFMAQSILNGLGIQVPDEGLAQIQDDPLFKEVNQVRKLRANSWMQHVGYTREKTVAPQPLGNSEAEIARIQAKIDTIRRK